MQRKDGKLPGKETGAARVRNREPEIEQDKVYYTLQIHAKTQGIKIMSKAKP
jgi:predicted N-formylglutamate amidohydrolase